MKMRSEEEMESCYLREWNVRRNRKMAESDAQPHLTSSQLTNLTSNSWPEDRLRFKKFVLEGNY